MLRDKSYRLIQHTTASRLSRMRLDDLIEDLRGAVRALRARPGFVLAALLTVGIPLGANSAIFSIIEAVLLRQLPLRDPPRVAVIWSLRKDGGNDPLSFPDVSDLQARARPVARDRER